MVESTNRDSPSYINRTKILEYRITFSNHQRYPDIHKTSDSKVICQLFDLDNTLEINHRQPVAQSKPSRSSVSNATLITAFDLKSSTDESTDCYAMSPSDHIVMIAIYDSLSCIFAAIYLLLFGSKHIRP
jgi:hypothetical protein